MCRLNDQSSAGLSQGRQIARQHDLIADAEFIDHHHRGSAQLLQLRQRGELARLLAAWVGRSPFIFLPSFAPLLLAEQGQAQVVMGLLLAGLRGQDGAVDRLRLRPGIQLQQAFRCCHLPVEPALMHRPAFEFGQCLLASPQCAQGLDPQLHDGPRAGS